MNNWDMQVFPSNGVSPFVFLSSRADNKRCGETWPVDIGQSIYCRVRETSMEVNSETVSLFQ